MNEWLPENPYEHGAQYSEHKALRFDEGVQATLAHIAKKLRERAAEGGISTGAIGWLKYGYESLAAELEKAGKEGE